LQCLLFVKIAERSTKTPEAILGFIAAELAASNSYDEYLPKPIRGD
jgi:hypothetical protein